PPVAADGGLSLTLRKPSRRRLGLKAFADAGLFDAVADAQTDATDHVDAELMRLRRAGDWPGFLTLAVTARRNILISGATCPARTSAPCCIFSSTSSSR
ncbi:MAG: hypothetical protein ACT6QO_16755, partial [Brevundimonas aurantiaca]